MARKKKAPGRVDELAELVSGLDGLNYELARDMLSEYVWMVEQMGGLKTTVEREGIVKMVYRGGADNVRECEEESKHFIAYQRLVPKVIATASAIKKFCKDNATESVTEDEFDAF